MYKFVDFFDSIYYYTQKCVDGKVEAAPFSFFGGYGLGNSNRGQFGEFFNLIAANHRNFRKSEKPDSVITYTFSGRTGKKVSII